MTTSERLLARFTLGFCAALLDIDTYEAETGERDDIGAYLWHAPSARWALEAFCPESRETIEAECREFVLANLRDVRAYSRAHSGAPDALQAWEDAGWDFLLTRNGHGTGFWDRGLGALGERLADAARAYGEIHAYTDTSDDATDTHAHVD